MTEPPEQDAHEQDRYPDIPTLEVDESIAPRPEEEAADVQRGTRAAGEAPEDDPR
jgi:hypothetical protein